MKRENRGEERHDVGGTNRISNGNYIVLCFSPLTLTVRYKDARALPVPQTLSLPPLRLPPPLFWWARDVMCAERNGVSQEERYEGGVVAVMVVVVLFCIFLVCLHLVSLLPSLLISPLSILFCSSCFFFSLPLFTRSPLYSNNAANAGTPCARTVAQSSPIPFVFAQSANSTLPKS